MLQQAAQGQRRAVMAPDRDPNPGPARVGDAADRGAGRHQIGIVQFKHWRRKADLPGANRTTVRKPDTSETPGQAELEHGKARRLCPEIYEAAVRREDPSPRTVPPSFSAMRTAARALLHVLVNCGARV